MTIAVVTPYHREPRETLLRCHASVVNQTVPCTHFLCADGFAKPELFPDDVRHIVLPQEHGDNGDLARALGAICAVAEGHETLAFLDADNWFDPDHLARAVEAGNEAKADVILTPRRIWLANGLLCPFEDEDVLRRRTADTSSIILARRALNLGALWGLIPAALTPICDRVMAAAFGHLGLTAKWCSEPTVNYESRWPAHYAAMGLPPPSDAHHTPWESVEAGYCSSNIAGRFGFDPFNGHGPRQATHKPTSVVHVG